MYKTAQTRRTLYTEQRTYLSFDMQIYTYFCWVLMTVPRARVHRATECVTMLRIGEPSRWGDVKWTIVGSLFGDCHTTYTMPLMNSVWCLVFYFYLFLILKENI